MLKQVSRLLLQAFLAPGSLLGLLGCWPPSGKFGHLTLCRPAHFRNRFKNSLVEFSNDMKFANLMRNIFAEKIQNRFRIQWRTVSRNTLQNKSTRVQKGLKPGEESGYVILGGVVVKDFKDQPAICAIIDYRQYAKWPVVQFVSSNISREPAEGPIQILMLDAFECFFFQLPQPSFERSQKERILDDHAISARMQPDTASRPPPRYVRRWK